MYTIQNITADPQQTQAIVVPTTGVPMTLQICYRPIQQGWYIVNLTYLSFSTGAMRITNSMNMLRQWKNLLPFGLACISPGNREPSLIQDFLSGASVLYLLSAAEVAEWEGYLANG